MVDWLVGWAGDDTLRGGRTDFFRFGQGTAYIIKVFLLVLTFWNF
ncbi:MAG: hypothetical protein CM15mP106_1290 [Candidatus Neomarinimicrobiota bacterium]|nr:MAG: hypothetical protein CM15mP106_1290 [Candidatus Neomarinimicrobiota bacterium]